MPTAGDRTANPTEFVEPTTPDEDQTCPNGEERCGGPDGDDLPCVQCFDPEQDYDVGDCVSSVAITAKARSIGVPCAVDRVEEGVRV